jgi:hypothetical protein
MERHPVPQNLMDVEFKLFGALTIRQFGYLAAGCFIGVMVYFSGLPVIVRIIFIGISVGVGFFLSLVKINGQPSTVWMSNFVLSMIVPQERLWRKSPIIPDVLKEDPSLKLTSEKDLVKFLTGGNKLGGLPKYPISELQIEETPLDKEEKQELDKIEEHFDFLFESLPKIQDANSNVSKPGTFKRKDELIEKMESPLIEKPKNIAHAASDINLNNSVVYSTDNYATVIKPMKTEVNRPLTMTKLPNENELEIKSNLDNNVNYIKGIVLNKKQQEISGVKVNILDKSSKLLKTLVTDRSGMFTTTSPLANGDYYIDCTSNENSFGRFMIGLNGQKVYLIKIIAK